MKIIVFGSCNIDTVYSVKSIVKAGETAAVEKIENFPGGKGFNQAVAAARAGAETLFAGCIGTDGDFLLDLLKKENINASLVRQIDGLTGRASIQVDANGENAILVSKGANGGITREHINEVISACSEGDIMLLQNETNGLEYILERARKAGVYTVLNPSPFGEYLRSLPVPADCVILNETEAREWAGSSDPLDFIAKFGSEFDIILTLGEKGGVYRLNGKTEKFNAYKADVVDTTAAGDTFTGYLFARLSSGADTQTAFSDAALAAAIAVSRSGAASSVPYLHEVLKKVSESVPLTF